jgi:GMP synthase (glutamine-hydrolysing)
MAPSAPTLLVIGHDTDDATTLVQAGTLATWAADRGVRLVPGTAGSPDLPGAGDVDAIAVLGSLEGAWDDDVPWLADEMALLHDADRRGTPVLGICFGGQLLARVLGGRVGPGARPETGWTTVDSGEPATVAAGPWLEFHFDTFTTPPGAERLATSTLCDQAFRAGPHLGVQFHPEITPAVYDTWARRWAGTGLEARLSSLGVSVEGLRDEIVARAGASRTASWALFDAFAAQAGPGRRMLTTTPREHADQGA